MFNLAWLTDGGRGVSANPAAANQLYRRACDRGVADACNNLGLNHQSGRAARRDLERAAALFARACDGGDALGCTNLGAAFEDGSGVAVDLARAARIHRRACAAGAGVSCERLAWLHRFGGDGVARDPARADQLFAEACARGDVNGCAQRALALLRARRAAEAAAPALADPLGRACDEGVGFACHALALAHAAGRDAARADARWRQAATALQRRCDADRDAWSCGRLAHLRRFGLGAPADAAAAAGLYARLCEESPLYCFEAAEVARPAPGAPLAPRRVALLERACEAQSARACYALAGHLERGDGVARDPARAARLRAGAAASLERSAPRRHRRRHHPPPRPHLPRGARRRAQPRPRPHPPRPRVHRGARRGLPRGRRHDRPRRGVAPRPRARPLAPRRRVRLRGPRRLPPRPARPAAAPSARRPAAPDGPGRPLRRRGLVKNPRAPLLLAASLAACAAAPPRPAAPVAAPAAPVVTAREAPRDALLDAVPAGVIAAVYADVGALMRDPALQVLWPLLAYHPDAAEVRATCGERFWEQTPQLRWVSGAHEADRGDDPSMLIAAGPIAAEEGRPCAERWFRDPARRPVAERTAGGEPRLLVGAPGLVARQRALAEGAETLGASESFADMSPPLDRVVLEAVLDVAASRARDPDAWRGAAPRHPRPHPRPGRPREQPEGRQRRDPQAPAHGVHRRVRARASRRWCSARSRPSRSG
jgi:TPR repeat protein